ncbi:unnamed protein product, partial [Didymodactylos carnosus]
ILSLCNYISVFVHQLASLLEKEMKRLRENDPLEESISKRSLSNGSSCPAQQLTDYAEYSPPNSLSSSSSCSSHSITQSTTTKDGHIENSSCSQSDHLTTIVPPSSSSIQQLCLCRFSHQHNPDCVIHNNPSPPQELTHNDNPSYYEKNLLLYYAHLARVKRHGTNIHSHQQSS